MTLRHATTLADLSERPAAQRDTLGRLWGTATPPRTCTYCDRIFDRPGMSVRIADTNQYRCRRACCGQPFLVQGDTA